MYTVRTGWCIEWFAYWETECNREQAVCAAQTEKWIAGQLNAGLTTMKTWVWISVMAARLLFWVWAFRIYSSSKRKEVSLGDGTSILSHLWSSILTCNWWKNKHLTRQSHYNGDGIIRERKPRKVTSVRLCNIIYFTLFVRCGEVYWQTGPPLRKIFSSPDVMRVITMKVESRLHKEKALLTRTMITYVFIGAFQLVYYILSNRQLTLGICSLNA